MQVHGTKFLVQLVSGLFIRLHWSNIWSIRGSYDACVALPLPAIVDLPPVASSGQFRANISWRRFSMMFRLGIKFWGNGSEGTNQVPYLWFCSGHPWARKWIQRLMITLSDTALSEWWSPARIILWTVSITTSCSVFYLWAAPVCYTLEFIQTCFNRRMDGCMRGGSRLFNDMECNFYLTSNDRPVRRWSRSANM